jgi:hypothetical protein
MLEITGQVAKGSGTETLNAYFNVKSDYSYAKIEANDNFVSVTNGDVATTIKVYLNNIQINVGDESFGINQTRNFAPSTTMYATYASEFKDTAFYVKLEVARVNTGFGWYAKVQEVKLKFRYFTLNYDDAINGNIQIFNYQLQNLIPNGMKLIINGYRNVYYTKIKLLEAL